MKLQIPKNKSQINSKKQNSDLKSWSLFGIWDLSFGSLKPTGFTLIEVLIVMAVAAAVGSTVFGILFTTLRSYNKANSVTLVRQNGENAISQMTRLIRSAKTFEGVGTGDDTFTTDCPQITPPPRYSQVKLTSFDGTSIVLSCEAETISLNGSPLINNSEVTLGENPCYFVCTQSAPSGAPRIDINFSLLRKDANNVTDKQAKLDFHTSVIPRNVGQ